MKLDQQLSLTRETQQHQKKFDDDVMSANCDVIVIFPIFDQFGAIWKPDSGLVKVTFSLIVTFYLVKTENEAKKFLTDLSRFE